MTGFELWAAEAVEWWEGAFPTETMEQLGLCLSEEVGELVRTILKESHGANDRRAGVDWKAERFKELGDVLIALAAIAHRDGVSLTDALGDGFVRVSTRFPKAIA